MIVETMTIEHSVAPPARIEERMSFDHVGHNLGWDFAAHGIKPPGTDDPAILRGFQEGEQRFGRSTIEADLFVRKWLQIRFNAFTRRRVFDDSVTPAFIAKICTNYCSITRVPMTVKTFSGSDWSVDRIINNGGYTPDNLMIISTMANRVKNDKTLEDIEKFVSDPSLDPRLKSFEWLRLYGVMQIAYAHAGLLPPEKHKLIPIVAFSPPHIPWAWQEKLQLCFLMMAIRKNCLAKLPKSSGAYHFFNAVKTSCEADTDASRLSHKIIARMRRKAPTVRLASDLWWDPATMDLLVLLIAHQQKNGLWPKVLTRSIDQFRGQDNASRICALQNDMALATDGYHFS